MKFKNVEIKYWNCDNNILGHVTLFNNLIIYSVSSVSCEATTVIQAEI